MAASITLPQLYERIASLPSGGALTNDSKLDKGFIYSLIHSARAYVVSQRWIAESKVPYVYYQRFEPDYRKLAQEDSCLTKFYDFPQVIQLDQRASGVGYVGTINGVPMSFREVTSRQAFASMQNDRVMKMGRVPYVLLEGNSLEVYYKDKIKEFAIEAIFADPTLVPTYNVDYDAYPVDIADVSKMEAYITAIEYKTIINTLIDRISNSRDEASQPIPNR